MYDLYSKLLAYGNRFPLNVYTDPSKTLRSLKEYDDCWHQYNPNKDIKRYGLSLINQTGTFDSSEDLDSLKGEHEIGELQEQSFDIKTPAYGIVKDTLDVFDGCLVRTHFLKLPPSGYFPDHIDNQKDVIDSFRLLVPIQNCNPPHGWFMLEDKPLYWEHGQMYFLNTCMRHTLFNASTNKDMIMLVLNVKLNEDSINRVFWNMM